MQTVTGDVHLSSVSPVSTIRPDFGGGSPGGGSGATPSETATNTPPLPPHGEVEQVRGELVDFGTQTIPQYFSFSAKTCLELLSVLSDEQLEHEFNYFKLLGCEMHVRAKAAKFKGGCISRELNKILMNQANNDFSKTLQKLETLTSSISHVVETQADAERARHERNPASPVTVTQQSTDETFLTPTASTADSVLSTDLISINDGDSLPDTVCSFNSIVNFDDISIEDVTSHLSFDKNHRGGRESTYFGALPYTYGNITHSARPYPECDVFTKIFDKLSANEPSFTSANFTCLVTLYPDGTVSIPAHSDNEEHIAPGSNIVTVSIGATRKLRFLNSVGRIKERDVEVANGSVYTMSAESQRDWTHCLLPDRQVSDPRISFTFRQLITPSAPDLSVTRHVTGSPIPTIKPPEPVKPRIAQGTHRRILFLTDSILKHAPPHIFNRVGGNDSYRCVMKMNYELANIFNFEPEFKYSDMVVISCGVNDLARYGRRPEVLADLVVRRLKDTCAANKNTTFVFNSILHTSHGWLNEAIDTFNGIMFNVSLNVCNFTFFDSHSVLVSSPISKPRSASNVGVIAKDDDGVHITFAARRLITDQLVNGLHMLACGREGKHVTDRVHGWTWPLRREYWDLVDYNKIRTIKGG